ncbi:hypothetical protein BURK1_00325 [Burkholderiales bacterium]|nr:hypothetical protein BURK1_00325 [Burkholderiales bacterium]
MNHVVPPSRSNRIAHRAHRALVHAWASPATLVGLLAAIGALATGATVRVVDGVVEVAGGRVERFVLRLPRGARFAAITFGHVVLGIDHATLAELRAHERVHVRQYERWGALFFPIYAASSLRAFATGRDPYRDNGFEREAFARCEARDAPRSPG